jgi:hypothetical protein
LPPDFVKHFDLVICMHDHLEKHWSVDPSN